VRVSLPLPRRSPGISVLRGAIVQIKVPARVTGIRVVRGRLVAMPPGTYRVSVVIRTKQGARTKFVAISVR